MEAPEGYIFDSEGSLIKKDRLRVYRVLEPERDALTSDFTILGFNKQSPKYEKGRKVKAEYHCVYSNDLIVEKIFSDELDDNGNLTGIIVTFNWYNEQNEIGLTKTEVVRKYNKYEAETEQRKRRERIIDFLVAGSKFTPIEHHLNLLFDSYYVEVEKFKSKGTDEFKNAIINETNDTLKTILNIIITPDGLTVKENILYQIN